MKGVIVANPGSPFEVVDSIEKPRPGKKQILVKSLVVGINPMENFMQGGLLVEGWPIVLGCDASGTVVEVGQEVTKFNVGDGAFGCTRLGFQGYMTFQEYFLMDEPLAFKRPKNVSVEQAATLGVASLLKGIQDSLPLFDYGNSLDLPTKPIESNDSSEWIIVLGGTASVGQHAIKIAKMNGLKVLASCSASNSDFVKSIGADATFNYKSSLEEQLAQIKSMTGGNFSRVVDASAQAGETALEALSIISTAKDKYFATVNDWDQFIPRAEIKIYKAKLGQLGRTGDEVSDAVNKDVASFIPKLEKSLGMGYLNPIGYQCFGEGFEGVKEGLAALNSGKGGGKKIIVKLQDE